MSVILNPIEQFFDLDGSPLQNGYIYLGDVSANPETNPVQVYWDAAFTIPAAQPIRTVNGFPVRSLNSGTPATIYTVNDVSMQVRNSKKLSVFYAPTSSQSSTSQNTLIRTSNTILTASDNARTVLASGTFSQTFDASVSLQNGWFVRYVNVGSGIITFDPNLSELIDGFTTEKLFAGQECTIYCNGIGLTTAGLAIDTDIVFTGKPSSR